VALLTEPPTPAERELARRGVAYEDAAETSARHLSRLGVSAVQRIASPVTGTEAEGRVLRDWCIRWQFKSVIVVSNADHSRRLRRVVRRSMRGCAAKVLVRSARYSRFNPDAWWLTRDGVRTEIGEFQKLLLDLASHPIS
jgi:hypothetical protein